MTTSAALAIYATSVLTAQAAELSTDQRATLIEKADRFRKLIGADPRELTSMSIPVIDPHTGATIGQVTYQL